MWIQKKLQTQLSFFLVSNFIEKKKQTKRKRRSERKTEKEPTKKIANCNSIGCNTCLTFIHSIQYVYQNHTKV